MYNMIIFREKIVDVDKSVLYDGLGKFNIALLCCLAISWIINFFLLVASNKFMKYVYIYKILFEMFKNNGILL